MANYQFVAHLDDCDSFERVALLRQLKAELDTVKKRIHGISNKRANKVGPCPKLDEQFNELTGDAQALQTFIEYTNGYAAVASTRA